MKRDWTTSEIQRLKGLVAEGYMQTEIASLLDRSYQSVNGQLRKLGLGTKKNKVVNKNVYAVYKGEQLIATGDLKELSKSLGVKRTTLRYYMTPSHETRTNEHNAIRMVKVD